MNFLEKSLRGKLENAVTKAREKAEAAALNELRRLGVPDAEAPGYLNEEQRRLRRRLRAHGRELGDSRQRSGVQDLDRLTAEVAYEHWHRMLFARFLAENELLIHPEYGVPVSLEECRELAKEAGSGASLWEVAAGFAAHMLPQIFRQDSPCFALSFAPEERMALEAILGNLPPEIFQAEDSLGWVYQFWQAKRKDEVNASEVKIGADELPAVTQLFTEPYMVSFLLDNSLGAWWAVKRLPPEDLGSGNDEAALRAKAALPGAPFEYLRFVRSDEQPWHPAAGSFSGWPESLKDFRFMDPCCGSGHFLVSVFNMLVPMRMALEGLTAKEACDAVLRENIYGLELDRRCVEIAAFALALAAWRYPGTGGYRVLPELHLACSGLSVRAPRQEWAALAADRKNLRIALDWLYEEFRDAPVLGSLINPARSPAARIEAWDSLLPALTEALTQGESDERREAGVTAQGLAKAAVLLSGRYHLVATNVPYLARGKQEDALKEFCDKRYSVAKNDLATVFLDRCLEFCTDVGTTAIVLPQNWLFLTTYRRFREKLLENHTWDCVARLGESGFESTAAAGAFTVLLTITRGRRADMGGLWASAGAEDEGKHVFCGIDASAPRVPAEKATQLCTSDIKQLKQDAQLRNPDARIAVDDEKQLPLLSSFADGLVGLQTSDDPMFTAGFWEVSHVDERTWELLQGTPDLFKEWAGASWLVKWEQGKGLLLSLATAYPTKGLKAVGKEGIAIHRMRALFAYRYVRERFHQNVAVILPHNPAHLPAIWCFCSSPEYNEAVRRIDQTLKVTNATLVKVPFDFDRWTNVAQEKYPHGLPKPYSDDPTQWIFHGHPARSDAPLQVAVARLLGYRWPAELDAGMELSDDARRLVKESGKFLRYADSDGVVCIPAVGGERPAADRLRDLLSAAYGDDWSGGRHDALLEAVDCGHKGMEYWLREKFFEQHASLFHHRPFIWQIWDGLKDGFSALVNYHKLSKALLQKLIYTHLGEWIRSQEQAAAAGVKGAEPRLAAAAELKKKLELVLEGEAPYDIFVRWKPLAEQLVGWDPDLNDGVRLNIRPFVAAGVLRHNRPPKLNIKWEKDRGKDAPSAPWYAVFKGARVNDHHLSLADKTRRSKHGAG